MSSNVYAVGVTLPQQGGGNYNYDEIQSSTGARCRQGMGSNIVGEVGVIGEDNGNLEDSGAVYGRIIYYFGAPERIDCSRLYEIEIETLRRELELLQRQQDYILN